MVLCKTGVLENFAKLTEEYLCRILFFTDFVKKILRQRCFRNFGEILRNTFFTEHFGRLSVLAIFIA